MTDDETHLVAVDPDAEAGDSALGDAGYMGTADELTTVFLGWSDSSDFEAWSGSGAPADLSGLGDGEAAARFIHAAPGAADVRLEFPGEALQACIALALEGLGRCFDQCDPYLFTDFEGTDRWEESGCPHDDDVVYGCLGYVSDNDRLAELNDDVFTTGFCIPRPASSATGGFGASCNANGDAGCNPDSFCVTVAEGVNQCSKLCSPYSGDGPNDCAETDVCAATLSQAVGVCVSPGTSAAYGETCSQAEEFEACVTDDTLCLQTTQTEWSCVRLCKVGVDGSCGEDARPCSRTGVAPALEPTWVGFCP